MVVTLLTALVVSAPLVQAKYDNNNEETLLLVQRALNEKSVQAMVRLGDIYAQGLRVSADRTEAITWYSYAVECGDEEAREKLWELEQGMRKKPISRARKGKPYNEKATLELCRYLYIATSTNLVAAGQVPEGMKLEPAVGGKFKAPKYDGAVVRKYIAQGADPNASVPYEKLPACRSFGGKVSPKFLVTRQSDIKTLDFMIAHGMCVNDANLGVAANALAQLNAENKSDASQSSPKMLQYALSRGADLNIRSFWGSTMAMSCTAGVDNAEGISYLASKNHDFETMVEERYVALVENPKRKSVLGACTMEMAVLNCNVRVVDALIRSGYDLNVILNGKTALDWAMKSGEPEEDGADTYEKELARILKAGGTRTDEMTVFKKNGRKTTKKTKTSTVGTVFGANKKKNLVHLLRLAGAKTAEEMKAAGGKDKQP